MTEVTTEETKEVKGTLLNTEDISDWGNENVLVEKPPVAEDGTTKPEVKAEPEIKEEVKPEVKQEEPEEEYVAAVTPDPGDFKPNDYSFEVITYDSEGKNGKTVKINSVEQWDQLLERDANFGSASSLLKAERLATKMEQGQDRDQRDWQTKKDAHEAEVQAENNRVEATNTMVSEIDYLVNRGDLHQVAAQYKNADWSDTEVASQPGVKEQIELLDYMKKENNSRIKAGLKPMTSVLDAFNAYSLDQSKKQQVDADKTAAEGRKAAGARVAGVTPAPVSVAPKGIAVGRAGSLNDLNANNWTV